MPIECVVILWLGYFPHLMGWRDDNGAQRRHPAVIQAFIIYGYAKKPRGTERFNCRIQFFQMPAKAFLAVVYTENNLRVGPCIAPGPCAAVVVGAQRLKKGFAIIPLISIKPDLAVFRRGKP